MASLSSSVSAGEVLGLILGGAADTRTSLAHVTGMSRSSIAERLDSLFAVGLVTEGDAATSTGGRPSRTIRLNPDSHLVLAADVGEDHVRVLVTDLRATVLAEAVCELAVSDGAESAARRIAEESARLLGSLGRDVEEVLGLGLSVPAPVDFPRGQVVGPSVMQGWEGVDIQAAFRRRIDVPVLVENDVNARGLGEFLLAWRPYDQVLYVKAGTGIGSAILTGGELYRGAQGAAGDIGHIRLDPLDGPLCRCGAIGCVEALAAGWSFVRDLQAEGLDVTSTREVMELVRVGEPRAIHRLRHSGRTLGRAIAYAVSMLNPSLVVLGGSLTEPDQHLLMGVRESVYQYSLPLATRELRIVQAQGDERCGGIGAAHLAIRSALEPDRVNALVRDHLRRDAAVVRR